ncbi:MAG: PQQ-binding-like beta-propeller repeat protein [Lentisphaerae bacterium]|nr:PQQ-binding-like beta-propeller repeat protein [Lentisphaerota bacterium]
MRRLTTAMALVALCGAGTAGAAETAGGSAAPETALGPRDYHLETALVEDGQARVTIVSSTARPAYAAIAEGLARRLREASGAAVPIVDAAAVTTDDLLRERHAIVLGNLATSPFVADLYWQWYTITDLWYPGPGGYELRTLHDPYGTGRNVIFLGGSDDDGVAAAAAALSARLTPGRTVTIGRLMDIHLGPGHTPPVEGQYSDPRLRIFHETLEHRTIHECPLGYSDASLAGLRYYYNGDEAALKRFREVALGKDFLSDGYHYYSHMHPVIWDLIEESPFFSDADRQAITARLLTYARGPDGSGGRAGLLGDAALHAASKKLLDRHMAMRANCVLTHSRYFGKYWPAAEWTENTDAARQYFDRLMTSAKGWRDEGNMHTYLECPLMAALLLRDRRIVDSGALRHYAELILMFCNNTGAMTTFGGQYPGVLRAAAALLNEPGLLATLPRNEEADRAAGKFPLPYGFMAGQAWDIGLQPEPMATMIGVYHRPATRWEWEHYAGGFPPEKALDKLCMRSGFGRLDQYLLLDGISVGGGKPNPNRNAILAFGDHGRTQLLGGAKSVVVSRQGLGADEGNLSSLEGLADLPGFGYSHSRAADHPFSSWDRHIFWRKGAWFVVLDAVTASGAGQHSVACNWTPLGSLRTDDEGVTCSRDEAPDPSTLVIRNAEPLRRVRVGNTVQFAECRDLAAGERVTATTLLYTYPGTATRHYAIAKTGPVGAVLSGDEEALLGLLPEGKGAVAGLTLAAAAYCLSPSTLALVDATLVRGGGIELTATAPCQVEIEVGTGAVAVVCAEAVQVRLNGRDESLAAGRHRLQAAALGAAFVDGLRSAIAAAVAAPRPSPAAVVPAGLPEIAVAWEAPAPAGGYAAYHYGDVDGDGRTELLLGLKDGRVLCLDDVGKTLWEHAAGGPVRALASAVLPTGPAILVGGDDETVTALDAGNRRVLWQHRCYVSEERYQAAPWWMMGYKAPVLSLFTADLDGDGQAEILCGTGGGFIECLKPDGSLAWKREFFWGLPNLFAVAPGPDGARHLLVDAANSASGSWTWRLDARGEPLSKNVFETGRGSWDSTVVTSSALADMDGQGAWMAAIGRGGAFNEIALYDARTGQRRWLQPMADRITCVATVDLDGDGTREVVAGSTSAWLCAFGLDGQVRWARQMPNAILAVTPVADGVVTQCADGCIYRLDRAGEVTAVHRPAALAPPPHSDHWTFQRAGATAFIGDRGPTLRVLRLEP